MEISFNELSEEDVDIGSRIISLENIVSGIVQEDNDDVGSSFAPGKKKPRHPQRNGTP